MVELQLDFDRALDDWTINGSPRDCVEAIARGREMGLENIGVTIYSLPADPRARIEYLQMIAEEVVAPAVAPAVGSGVAPAVAKDRRPEGSAAGAA